MRAGVDAAGPARGRARRDVARAAAAPRSRRAGSRRLPGRRQGGPMPRSARRGRPRRARARCPGAAAPTQRRGPSRSRPVARRDPCRGVALVVEIAQIEQAPDDRLDERGLGSQRRQAVAEVGMRHGRTASSAAAAAMTTSGWRPRRVVRRGPRGALPGRMECRPRGATPPRRCPRRGPRSWRPCPGSPSPAAGRCPGWRAGTPWPARDPGRGASPRT